MREVMLFGVAGLNERAFEIVQGWQAKKTSKHYVDSCGRYNLREFVAPDGRMVVEELQKLRNGYAFHALRDLRRGTFVPNSRWTLKEMDAFPDGAAPLPRRKIGKSRKIS